MILIRSSFPGPAMGRSPDSPSRSSICRDLVRSVEIMEVVEWLSQLADSERLVRPATGGKQPDELKSA